MKNTVNSKQILVYIILGIILFSMVFKSQVVIVSYGDDYSLRMEYTVYGYCIRASAALKATEPAVYNEMYIGNTINTSILKAAAQLENLGGTEEVFRIKSTGFPRNNSELELQIKQILEETNRTVEIYENIPIKK